MRSFSNAPVFIVVTGSNSIIETSSSAIGLCSTPLGTMIISFSWIVYVLSLNAIFKVPSRTKNISSSSSCLCQINSPLIFASLIC